MLACCCNVENDEELAVIDGVQGAFEGQSKLSKAAERENEQMKKDSVGAPELVVEGTAPTMPAEESNMFTLTVVRKDAETPLGIKYDHTCGRSLHVCGLETGSSALSALEPETLPQDHDFIMEVNGIKGHARKMAKEIEDALELNLVLSRPKPWTVSMRRASGASLGLDLHHLKEGGMTLVVAGLTDGCVTEWNATNPGKEVKRKDRIIEVNGVRGSSPELFETIKAAETVDLVMISPVAGA